MRSAVRQLPLRLSIQRLSLRPTLRLPFQRYHQLPIPRTPRDQRQHPRLQRQCLRRHRCVVIPLLSLSLSLSHSRTLSLTHCLSPSHLPHPPISHIDGDGGHVRAFVSADYLWAFVRANIESDGSTHVSNDSAYEGTGASSFLFSLSHAHSLSLTVSLPLISRLLPSLT